MSTSVATSPTTVDNSTTAPDSAAEPAGTTTPARSPAGILKPALLFLALLAAYGPALDGAFLWDDDDNIVHNMPLRTVDGPRRIWLEPGATQQYFPVLHTIFWAEYHVWGDHPRGYHVVNLMFHFGAAVLLAGVLRRLQIPGADFAAAIFALHPVCVESVAWITEGKNTVSLFFFLAALLAYLRNEGIGAAAGAEPATVRRSSIRYAFALVLFALAVLSKTNAVTWPAVVLVLLCWKRGRLTRGDLLRVLPMLALGAAVAAVVVHVERNILGTGREEFAWPLTERLLVAGRALWFYLGKILWPHPLTFIYPRRPVDPHDALQWLLAISAALLPVVLWRLRLWIGSGTLVAALCFGGTLLPQLGLLPLYGQLFSYVADHWVYLSAPAAIVWAAAVLTRAMSATSLPRPAQKFAAVLLLALLAGLTWRQAQIYRDPETLWADTITKNPDCWLAHHNLAVLRMQRGDYPRAAAGLDRALELRPEFKEAYNNRGVIAQKQNRTDVAKQAFERALEIDPRFADAHANLGALAIARGDNDAAVAHLLAALGRKPDYAGARASLGLLYARLGRAGEGTAELRTALARNPKDVAAMLNLGTLLAQQKRFDEARALFEQALEVDPDSAAALLNLGGIYLAQGDFSQARQLYAEAVQVDPADAAARFHLGNALVRLNRLDEAVAAYEQAVALQPADIGVRLNLAAVKLGRGDPDAAKKHLEVVLRLQPEHPQARQMWAKLPRTATPVAPRQPQ